MKPNGSDAGTPRPGGRSPAAPRRATPPTGALRALIAAALAAGLACPVAADEYAAYDLMTLTPRGAAGAAACSATGLLNLPAAWQSGDAVVVLVGAGHDAHRDRLISSLLAEHAAVLEVSLDAHVACAGDAGGPPRARADAVDLALSALVAARDDAGGGLIVAIGHGPGGDVALAAVDEPTAALRLGPGGARFAAALSLGGGPAVARRGAAQAEAEQTGMRLGLLCDAIARSDIAWSATDAAACLAGIAADRAPAPVRPVALRR